MGGERGLLSEQFLSAHPSPPSSSACCLPPAADLAWEHGGVDAGLAGELAQQHWAAAVEAALASLPHRAASSASAATAALSSLVASVGRRLLRPGRPASVAFPLPAVVGSLEALAVRSGWPTEGAVRPGAQSYHAAWLGVAALGAAGVPWAARFETYRDAADAAVASAAAGEAAAADGEAGGALALHWVQCAAAVAVAWARAAADEAAAAAAGDGGSRGALSLEQQGAAAGASFLSAADGILAALQHWRVALPTISGDAVARAEVAALIDAARSRTAAAQRRVPVGSGRGWRG